jgi:hypothetical protein
VNDNGWITVPLAVTDDEPRWSSGLSEEAPDARRLTQPHARPSPQPDVSVERNCLFLRALSVRPRAKPGDSVELA